MKGDGTATSAANVSPAHGLRRPLCATTPNQLDGNLASLDVQLGEEERERLDDVSAIDLGFPHDFLAQPMAQGLLFGETRERIDDEG